MRQVIAYNRLNTMENHQPSGPKKWSRLFPCSHAFCVTEFGDWDLYSCFVVIFGACANVRACASPGKISHVFTPYWRLQCHRTRKGHFSSYSTATFFPELAQVESLLGIPSTLFNLFSPTECNFCYLLHVRSTVQTT